MGSTVPAMYYLYAVKSRFDRLRHLDSKPRIHQAPAGFSCMPASGPRVPARLLWESRSCTHLAQNIDDHEACSGCTCRHTSLPVPTANAREAGHLLAILVQAMLRS